jgi:hypothetical protein
MAILSNELTQAILLTHRFTPSRLHASKHSSIHALYPVPYPFPEFLVVDFLTIHQNAGPVDFT